MEEKLETIRVVAMEMAADIVMCYSERTPRDARCKYTSVMRRMVEKLLHQYGTTFNQLVSSLDLNEENVCLSFKNIADEVIRGDINWGRIVTLYAMAAQFAMFATTSGQGHILCRLVETCSGYICDRLLTWINTHGGWVSVSLLHKKCLFSLLILSADLLINFNSKLCTR